METFESAIKEEPAVKGENTAGGVGLSGVSEEGRGVEGRSTKGVGVVGVSEDYRGIEGRSTNEHAIFGRSTKGAGVAGISEDNRGVHGRSTNEHGVFGESAKGAGVAGFSENYRGVQGSSTNEHGVFGTSTKGAGVAGVSEKWVGVYGKGSHLAGFFDGNVNITHDLIVNGKAVINGAVLEIAEMVQRIALLEQWVAKQENRPVPPPPASSNYSITVSVTNSQFVLEGTGFQPNKTCYVHMVYPDLSRNVVTQSSDPTGKLRYVSDTSSWCLSPGMQINFSVNQPDSAGRDKWSNVATTSCP